MNELKNLKTEIRNNIDALKQLISHIEDIKDPVELKIRKLKRRIENLHSENPFDFTESLEMQKEEIDIDFCLFFELAEENKIINNQVPVNTLIEDMEKLKNGFHTLACFTLGDDEGEINTNRFFEVSKDLANVIDKIFDEKNVKPSIYYSGIFYRYFRNFKRVNSSDHGRGDNEFKKFLGYDGQNCYILSGNASFLK